MKLAGAAAVAVAVAAALAGCGSGGGGGGETIAPPAQGPSEGPSESPVATTSISIGDTFTPNSTDDTTGSASGEFNYQSYGAWVRTGPPAFPGDVVSRARSSGTATPGNSIPTTGTATFTGSARGFMWISGNGQRSPTTADMTAGVDFERREVAFGTSNTFIQGGTLPFS